MNEKFITFVDQVVKYIVAWSVLALIFEIGTGTEHSREGSPFWLWSERVVALFLTIEYIARCKKNINKPEIYPLSPFGLIDLISILPFWIGFFVPVHLLDTIRTLRVFRLLKWFRYSRNLQLVALGFYKATRQIRDLSFMAVVLALFATIGIYEAEREVQPEFNSLFNCFWFTVVTASTVGYGDISPVTYLGKVIMMLFMFGGLGIFAAAIGVLNNSFYEVRQLEKDPNIDPIAEFKGEWEKKKFIRRLNRDYVTKEE